MMQWISVKDRLPVVEIDPDIADVDGMDNGRCFLTCDEDGCIEIVPFYAKRKGFAMEDIGITHWMPLPEPPKE